MWKLIFDRLKEPSTMAGLSVLLGVFGVPHAPELMQGAGQIVVGIAGLLAVAMPERSGA